MNCLSTQKEDKGKEARVFDRSTFLPWTLDVISLLTFPEFVGSDGCWLGLTGPKDRSVGLERDPLFPEAFLGHS